MLGRVERKIMSDLFCIRLWRMRNAAANKGRFGSCRALARVRSSFTSYWIAPAVQSLKWILKALKDSCPAPLPHLPGWERMRAFLIVNLCCTLGSFPAHSPSSWCNNVKGSSSQWDSQQLRCDTSQPSAGWMALQIRSRSKWSSSVSVVGRGRGCCQSMFCGRARFWYSPSSVSYMDPLLFCSTMEVRWNFSFSVFAMKLARQEKKESVLQYFTSRWSKDFRPLQKKSAPFHREEILEGGKAQNHLCSGSQGALTSAWNAVGRTNHTLILNVSSAAERPNRGLTLSQSSGVYIGHQLGFSHPHWSASSDPQSGHSSCSRCHPTTQPHSATSCLPPRFPLGHCWENTVVWQLEVSFEFPGASLFMTIRILFFLCQCCFKQLLFLQVFPWNILSGWVDVWAGVYVRTHSENSDLFL